MNRPSFFLSPNAGASKTVNAASAIKVIDTLLIILLFIARTIAFPLLVLYFLGRGYRDSKYFRHFRERLGILPASFKRTAPGSAWLHAVSVGEVISCVRLIEELRARNPGMAIYVSTTTLAGREVAEQKLGLLVSGIFYAPLDYAWAVRRVIRRIRPTVLTVLETEIWPVLFREVKRAGCALVVVNGRISDRTAARYRSLRWLFRSVLALPDAILVQSEQDRNRYIAAGAPGGSIEVIGNLKYAAKASPGSPPRVVLELIKQLRPEAVWIAASTMPGIDSNDVDEDDAVLSAFRELSATRPRLLLILVPRRPERFAVAEEKLRVAGIPYMRRSAERIPNDIDTPCVLLMDTMGELASLLPLADVVFMGGTLARRGGHNALEPAACGKAIVAGPHMENFASIAAEFRARGAWLEVPHARQLAGAVGRLLDDAELRERLGQKAAGVARTQTGVVGRVAAVILERQDCAIPEWRRPGPSKPLLWALAQLWKWGDAIRRRRDFARLHSLDTPVISVGGISMGGSGKTPFVAMLAESLASNGTKPAILTRGYRRRSVERAIVVRAGAGASSALTGDEAQIFVRAGCAHVGIGSDRWQTGRLVEEALRPGVFLLDDGFQHRRLARQLDIVLIDALNPFPGGAVFPLGFLREPMQALRRADLFVITRAQPQRGYAGIRAKLREYNPKATVLCASVEPKYWVNFRTGEKLSSVPERAVAFCGLGNPDSFWQTLDGLGIAPAFTWVFGDHHHYRPRELRRLAAQARSCGASVLLTTEKDAMNLPDDPIGLLQDLLLHDLLLQDMELYWLRIGLTVR